MVASGGSLRLARIEWEGDSHCVLVSFPEPVVHNLGYALYLVQLGEVAPGSRRMASVGPGVFELREQDARGWYRVIYLARREDVVHVLHCFEKKSRKTPRKELETAKARLKQAVSRRKE